MSLRVDVMTVADPVEWADRSVSPPAPLLRPPRGPRARASRLTSPERAAPRPRSVSRPASGSGFERQVALRLQAVFVADAARVTVSLGELPALAAVDPATLSGAARVDLIAAWERVAAMVDGLQQRALAAVVEATEGVGLDGDVARHEVGAALRLSPGTAARRTRTAADLATRLPVALDRLVAGRISYRQAAHLADAVTELPEKVAAAVAERVLDRAEDQTVAEFRRSTARAVLAADPDGAAERHDRAAAARRVQRHPLPEAMTGWWVTLPAHLESAAWAALSATARATQDQLRAGAGDDPGLDALRVDTLLDALHAHAHPGGIEAGGATDAGGVHAGGVHAGGVHAGGVHAGGVHAGGVHAGGVHAGGVHAGGVHAGGVHAAGGATADGPTATGATKATVTTVRGGPTTEGGLPRCRCGGAQTAAVVVDLPTLLGLAEHPGHLPGHGPIPAGLARELAADRDWQRWTRDPDTRRLLDRGPDTYRPSDRLRAFIAAAHGRCGFPGCPQPATRCDCDHRIPFSRGGRTTVANLGPLCRQHHNAKTHGHWQVTYDDTHGLLTWTSPLGKTYTKSIDPILE